MPRKEISPEGGHQCHRTGPPPGATLIPEPEGEEDQAFQSPGTCEHLSRFSTPSAHLSWSVLGHDLVSCKWHSPFACLAAMRASLSLQENGLVGQNSASAEPDSQAGELQFAQVSALSRRSTPWAGKHSGFAHLHFLLA